MKKRYFSLLLLACLPFLSVAQQTNSKAPTHNYELSALSGLGYETDYGIVNDLYIGSLNTISLYRNINRTQIGLGVDIDVAIGNGVLMAPHLIVNRTLELNKFNFYAGVMAGYAHLQHSNGFGFQLNKASKGYTSGAQAGMLYKMGNHFAVNGELAARGVRLWNRSMGYDFSGDVAYPNGEISTYSYFTLYYVAKIGLRYRF